jgi:hypothetical protein
MLHPERLRRMSGRQRLLAAAGVVAVVAVVVALIVVAAGGDGADEASGPAAPQLSLPPPSFEDVPVVTLPEGFVQPDTRGIRLSPVIARPRGGVPPLPVYGGKATITGTVVGPDGPVPGATVKLERWVGDRGGSENVATGGDGRFVARNLLGGRYRVRAWLQPNLAATESQVAFLADDGGSADLEIPVDRFEGTDLQAGLDVSVINVEGTARIRGLLTRTVVDEDGIVVGEPMPGVAIALSVTDGLSVQGDSAATTGDNGIATWTVRCEREGAHAATLTTEGASAGFTLPNCGPKPQPPPEVPDFPVGQEFSVPRAAPIPLGTYVTAQAGCVTSYQIRLDGAWEPTRRQSDGNLTLLAPARDLQPAPGTPPCTFRRVS